MFEDAIRILSKPPVVRAARRLHVGHVPRLGPEHAQQRLGMRSAGTHLEVERLLNDASLRRPEGAQFQDEILEGHDRVMSFRTLIDRGSRSRCIAMMLRCSASSSRSIARSAPTPARSCGAILRAAVRNACASGDRPGTRARRIHPLQAQQPVLEVSRQRLGGHTRGKRFDHRDAETVQPLVLMAFRRPFVDQFGKIRRTPERLDRARSTAPIATAPSSSN